MASSKTKDLQNAAYVNRWLGQRYYQLGIGASQFRNDQLLAALGMSPMNRQYLGSLWTGNASPSGMVPLGSPEEVKAQTGDEPDTPGAGSTSTEEFDKNFSTPGDETLGASAGMPAYLSSAFRTQRAGLADAQALASRASAQKSGFGFTNAAYLQPRDLGAEIARARSTSFLNQSLSQAEQATNLLQMAMGGTGQVGSASLQAAGNQLQAISMMNPMASWANPLAAALGAGSAGLGSYINWQGANPQLQPGMYWSGGQLPPGTSYAPTLVGSPGGNP